MLLIDRGIDTMKAMEELYGRIQNAVDDGAAGAVVDLYNAGFLPAIAGNDRATDLRFYMEKVGVDKQAIEYWSNF
jgi:hypothetical protein